MPTELFFTHDSIHKLVLLQRVNKCLHGVVFRVALHQVLIVTLEDALLICNEDDMARHIFQLK